MKKSRFTEVQMVTILREADRRPVPEVVGVRFRREAPTLRPHRRPCDKRTMIRLGGPSAHSTTSELPWLECRVRQPHRADETGPRVDAMSSQRRLRRASISFERARPAWLIWCGPDLVATLGAHQWLAVGSRDLLASTALQLEPGLRVQAIDPCVIDDVAGLPQLQIDHPGPIASMSLRQVNDPIPDDRIAIGPWHVPEGRRAHPPHGQGPALAEAPRDHLPHHLPSNRCGHHVFHSTSRVTSISSCDSAKSFLSRPFSVSSSFRRFASETLIPPNLLRQR